MRLSWRSSSRTALRLGNKVIEAQHVAKAFGDKLLFDDLNFMLPRTVSYGVIGPNGAGKTTLFKMIMGMESIDKGDLRGGRDRTSRLRRPDP